VDPDLFGTQPEGTVVANGTEQGMTVCCSLMQAHDCLASISSRNRPEDKLPSPLWLTWKRYGGLRLSFQSLQRVSTLMVARDSEMSRLSLESGCSICWWNHVRRIQDAGCRMASLRINTLSKHSHAAPSAKEHERE